MAKLTKTLALPLCILLFAGVARAQDTLRIVGASTVVLPVKDAAEILKKEQNLVLEITPVVNSTPDKIYALGEGHADIAMVAHPLTGEDRAPYPDLVFKEIQIGEEAAALVVSQDLWNAGVRSITKEQARAIYEEKIKNWKEIGGPDLAITGYLSDSSRGAWACCMQWLYDDPATIPENHFTTVKSDDEVKTYLDSTPGAIAPVPILYAAGNHLHALAVKTADSKLIQPAAAAVADHSYPMARPLIMIIKGRPLGDMQTFVKFMVGDRGQQLVRKYNYLTLKDLGITPPSF